MDREDIQRVVDLEGRLNQRNDQLWHHTGNDAEDQRARYGYGGTGRGDGDQTGDSTGCSADQRWLTAADGLEGHPGDDGSRGTNLRVEDDVATFGHVAGEAGVKAVPADPQHRSTDHDHAGLSRGLHGAGETGTLAEQDREDQRRNTSGLVHDQTTSVVNRVQSVGDQGEWGTLWGHPDPVGQRAVYQQRPQHGESQHEAELHALGVSTEDQRRGDNREGQAEGSTGEVSLRRCPEQQLAEVRSEQGVTIRGRQGVTGYHPGDGDNTGDRHALHEHGEVVFGADQTAVEQRKAGDRHKQDERRCGQEPGAHAHRGCLKRSDALGQGCDLFFHRMGFPSR